MSTSETNPRRLRSKMVRPTTPRFLSEPADAPFDALASAGAAVERIAKALIDEVIARDTNDNMTVVLLAFPDAFHPFFGERLLRDRADKDRAAAEAAAADAAATDEAERDL
jgi:dienelactone hydrolase